MNQLKKILALCAFSLLISFSNVSAKLDLIKTNINLNKDYTFTQEITVIATVVTPQDISELQTTSQDFFPSSQKLEVEEAYVIHPDGEKIVVPETNITTELSAASQDAPGFTNSHTKRILFPQLRVGSQTHVIWKINQIKPFPIGYNNAWSPPFYAGVKDLQIRITFPKDLKLYWKERGGFKVEDTIKGRTRTLAVRFENAQPHPYQNSTPSPLNFSPVFVVSSFSSWENLASKLYKASKNNDAITSKIQDLSNQIVGDKKGKDAAEAIYNWVAQNIQYVAVYLNAQQEIVAHPAEEILKNGYGDCKDHITLMQALLKVQGIRSFLIFVNWGTLYKTLPWANEAQFDHVMIYLPEYNIFANPTNPFAPFGGLGQGLDGKFVIILTPEGKIAHLPMPKPQDNTYKNQNTIEILSDGTVKGSNILISTGNMNTLVRYAFSDWTSKVSSLKEQAQNLLSQNMSGGYGNFILSSSPYDLSVPFTAKGTWTSSHSFSLGEETAFFWIPIGLDIVNPHTIRDQITPRKRLYPFISNYFPGPVSPPQYIYPARYIWSYEVKIPQSYALAQLPSDVSIKTPEGSYKSSYSQKGDTLFVERSLIITKTYFSVKEYEALRPVLYKLENDFNTILMLKKKQ